VVTPFTFNQTIDVQGNVGTDGLLSYGKDLFTSVGDYLDGSSMTVKVQ